MRLSEILEVSLAAKGMRFDALLAPVRVSEPTVLEDLLSHVDAALDILHEFVAEVRVSDVLPADLSRDRLMTVLVDDLGALLQWMETTLDREVEWAAKLQPSPTE